MPEINISAMERKLTRSLSSPSHVWWEGPQDACKKRETGELDPYHIWDCDGVIRKCGDARWRTIHSIDTSMQVKFGPSAKDIKWGAKIPEARPNMHSSPLSFKLDPYNAKLGNSFMNTAHNNYQVFAKPRGERFTYPKKFLRDYTRAGQITNVMRSDSQALDHESIRKHMNASRSLGKTR